MLIGLSGASGFLGSKIIDLAIPRGHEIVAFSRTPERSIPGCTMRKFSLDAPPDISGCEAVINLAGEPVAGLWTAAKKRRIVESRVLGTRRVVEAMAAASPKPEVLVNASGVGFYGERGEEELTESLPPGKGFFPETAEAWEAEALKARDVRVVLMRTALVLGRKGGALPLMALPFRFGLGAQLGNGRQWMPWIHVEDWARLVLFAIENLDLQGPMNAAAPWPVRNADFTRVLAHHLRRPAFLRAPAFFLRMVLREFSCELLESKRVLPGVACDHGFGFRFSELDAALKNLVG
ncbi:MAG TPA: TIGR01777 family oxidoreductase [Chthoniobacter sp.]|jgi:hypothetical protein